MSTAAGALPTRLLHDAPQVFRRLVAFNSQPAGYVHESRRETLGMPGVDAQVWEQPRSFPFMSRWILERLGMNDRWFLDPACDIWPLALLPTQDVLALARHVGGTLAAPRIRQLVQRGEVLEWKYALTPAAYRFALASAVLLPAADAVDAPRTGAEAVEQGYAWIAACLKDAPDELRARAELKLPAGCTPAGIEQSIAWRLVSRVLSAMDPQWCSSFKTRN